MTLALQGNCVHVCVRVLVCMCVYVCLCTCGYVARGGGGGGVMATKFNVCLVGQCNKPLISN